MSKHRGRKSRWVETSPICFVSACGKAVANPRGKWDAIIRYRQRISTKDNFFFAERNVPIGEYKRARQAMMAVEDRAKRMLNEPNDDILIITDF